MDIQASAFETDGNSAVSFKTSPTPSASCPPESGKIPRLFHREAVEEMEIQLSFAEGVKQGESIRKANRGRGSRPRLLLSSSGRFQGSQERLSFKGFLQGFFSAEHSRGIKKPSFEGS